jgi:hypothetical protein
MTNTKKNPANKKMHGIWAKVHPVIHDNGTWTQNAKHAKVSTTLTPSQNYKTRCGKAPGVTFCQDGLFLQQHAAQLSPQTPSSTMMNGMTRSNSNAFSRLQLALNETPTYWSSHNDTLSLRSDQCGQREQRLCQMHSRRRVACHLPAGR